MKINTMGIWGNLHQSLNLQDLVAIGSAIRITNSRGYLSLTPTITACIYKTGKVQIYGNKEINDVQPLWQKTVSALRSVMPLPDADKDAQVKFIVASETLPYSMNLHKIVDEFPDDASIEYEPEQFPGLIWKLESGTCLLFTSGNIVITGPNSIEKIEETIAELRAKIDPLFM